VRRFYRAVIPELVPASDGRKSFRRFAQVCLEIIVPQAFNQNMKKGFPKFVAAGAVLSMLAGCIVLSVYPFYNAKDLTFNPAMAGRWAKNGTTNEFWEFTVSGEKSYALTTTDTQDTNCFTAHLFHLKQYQFLDLLTTNRSEFQLPLHLISQVTLNDTNLSLHFLDYGWLANQLETNPAILRHIVELEKPDDTNSDKMVYLTAGTADLQKFLLKHADDTNAFSSDSAVELQRAP
jgi:hypothetical protein